MLSPDVIFGVEIVALPAPPRLTGVSSSAPGIRVDWDGDAAWKVVGERTFSGSFTPVPGNPTSSYLIPAGSAAVTEFFRLRYRAGP